MRQFATLSLFLAIFAGGLSIGFIAGTKLTLAITNEQLEEISYSVADIELNSAQYRTEIRAATTQLMNFRLDFEEFQQDMISTVNDWSIK